MANRLVGNVYIIDSGEGATVGLSWWPDSAKVAAFGFYGANTTAELILTMGGTNNQVVHFTFITQVVGIPTSFSSVPGFQSLSFGDGVYFDQLAVGLLTAGTGWIYFA